MEVVHGPRARRPRRPRSCTPTRTRCSATPRSALANNIVIGLAVALALVAALVARGRGAPARAASRASSRSAVLGFLFATYAAEPLHFGRSDNSAAYFGFLVRGRARVRGRVPAARRPPSVPPARASRSRSPSSCTSLDLLAGARLELNTVFGYSATVGIRVVGPGQHHVLAAHRGGAAARWARGVATARAHAPCTR